MKKILLLLLLAFTANVYAQESVIDIFKSKEKRQTEAARKTNPEFGLPKSNIAKAGYYQKKSANYQYGAIGCAAASSGLLIGYASLKDKFELNDKGDTKMTGKAKGLLIGGSIFALTAIIIEIQAIKYKFKSGQSLLLHTNENGAGLAYTF